MRHKVHLVSAVGADCLRALGVITSQHLARKLYSELEKNRNSPVELEVEFGKLQLEQSTWAAHSLIERAATDWLSMHIPDPREVQVVQSSLAKSGVNDHGHCRRYPPFHFVFQPQRAPAASRMRLVGMVLGLLFVALLGRSIYLQLVKQDFLQTRGLHVIAAAFSWRPIVG